MRPESRIVLGVDLGKVTTSIALEELDNPGPRRCYSVRHRGDPLSPFLDAYREIGARNIVAVGATGVYSARLSPPVLSGLPEEIAQEQATRLLYPGDSTLNVVRIGGAGFSVLSRDGDGTYRYERNDRCSAGTGETMERICARLGATLEQADTLAAEASRSIPITARCSVFAKSELTHFANQGEEHGPLFRGYFESVAKNVAGLVERNGIPGPVVLIGHGALIARVAEALGEVLQRDVTVSPEAGVFEAIGALAWARQHGLTPAADGAGWPEAPESLVVAERRTIRSLRPAGECGGEVRRVGDVEGAAEVAGGGAAPRPAVLGLDLGSTGSKAALLDLDSGRVIADVYRRTDGNPVEAARALLQEITAMAPAPVVGVGLTGSGRDAAATVFRAALTGREDRLLVQNEIVAHATAAMLYDPDGGRSLSIVEIGGQDAKFINIKNGSILESDMNRACSAGTGSFLEEQAVLHGVDDIGQFGEMAGRATRPPDLGQMCTVFVADLASEALTAGYQPEDVFAGFQYAVIKNYKNRVMGNRQFLDRIFFQGKPASSRSLARTLAAVTGRTVYVPPNPGAMGAIGIAMMVRAALGERDGHAALDLSGVVQAEITERRVFRCQDRDCQNMCRIESASVRVGEERRRVVSGGNCPKYDVVGSGGRKLPKEAPNAYRERRELLARLASEDRELAAAGGLSPDGAASGLATFSRSVPCGAAGPALAGRVVMPVTHYLHDGQPFFHALFSAMGLTVDLMAADEEALALGDRLCRTSSACAPVKIAHGLAGRMMRQTGAGNQGADGPHEGRTEVLFAPKIVHLPESEPGCGVATCPLGQGCPEMVETVLRAAGWDGRFLRPVFLEGRCGWDSPKLAREVVCFLRSLPVDLAGKRTPRQLRGAVAYAVARQLEYERGLEAIGRRTLEFAMREGFPVVLLTGETHIIHDPVVNPGIEEVVSANGALALPVDCYPLPAETPPLTRIHWAGASRALRASVDAAMRGCVYPILLGGYGCGPGSFVEHIFNDLLSQYPHTILESDGHSGRAGYVTRVQAFLHSVREYEAGRGARKGDEIIPKHSLGRYDRFPIRSFDQLLDRKVVFGTVGGGLGGVMAAALRGFGVDAAFSGETDQTVMRLAQEGCTGKECLPYQMIWGSFAGFLARRQPEYFTAYERPPLLLSVGLGFQACRANVFHLAEEIAAERSRLPGRVEVSDLTIIMRYPPLTGVAWAACVAVDILNALRFHHLAGEAESGSADRLFGHYSRALEKLLERPMGRDHWKEVPPTLRRIRHLLSRAAASYATLPRTPGAEEDIRDVYLCGDVFLRVNEWSNDDLHHRLSSLGLRVSFEPFAELFEILALRETQDHAKGSRDWLKHNAFLVAMNGIREWLLAAVRPLHPWLDWFDIRQVDAESRRLLDDGYPFGESIPTIGGTLLAWRKRPIDGVVVVGPRGCGPALISEAQLRHATGIPLLLIYNDGDPIDQARLAGFAWRLRGRPPRNGVTE